MEMTQLQENITQEILAKSSKFLTFNLDENNYGIPILKVSEIIGITQITPIPKTPSYMKGVINLRGKIIPAVDLRLKLEMAEKEYDTNTCIIIINSHVANQTKQIGVIVDIVSEVCNIEAQDIEPSPEYGDETNYKFITGIGKIKDKVVMLLDIDKILTKDGAESFLLTDLTVDMAM